jgi:hypothetical protein
MTTGTAGPGLGTVANREPGQVRLVWDVELAVDEVVAELVRGRTREGRERGRGPRGACRSWSTDAALVALRGRRLAQARQQRIEELAWIAGPMATQVSISMQRRRLRGPHTSAPFTPPATTTSLPSLIQEGLLK